MLSCTISFHPSNLISKYPTLSIRPYLMCDVPKLDSYVSFMAETLKGEMTCTTDELCDR